MRLATVVLAIFALSLLLISGCRDVATGTFGSDEDVMPSDASGGADVTMASDLGDADVSADGASGWTCQLDSRVRPFCRSVGFGPGHPYWQDYVQPLVGFSKKLLPDIVYDLISYEAGPGSICDEFWDEIPFDPTSESLISFSRIYEDGTGTCCDNTTFIGGRGYTCSGPVGREAPNGLYADLSGPGYVCCGVSKTVPPELCSDGPKAAFVQYYRFPRGSYTALRPEGVPEAAEALFQKLNLPDSYPPSPRAPEDPICDHWGYGLNERPIEVFE